MGNPRQDKIPYEEGGIPPVGYLLVQDQNGNRFWLSPDKIRPGRPVSELTQEQIERVKRCSDTLAGVHGLSR